MKTIKLRQPIKTNLTEKLIGAFEGIKTENVDADNNIITNCCLFGRRESANQRIYSNQAIESLTRLSNGVHCYLNHPTKTEMKERNGVRDVRDLAGVYRDARREGDKVIADLHCREEYFDLFKYIALEQPLKVGNSINAIVMVSKDPKNGMESIEDVSDLRSVDLVSNAATTDNLFESALEENLDQDLSILLESTKGRIKEKFTLIILQEGILQSRIDNQKIKSEINDITWIANDLIYDVLNRDLNITQKKNKIIEIFDDLDKEIKKRLKKMSTESKKSNGGKTMELTLEQVMQNSEIMKALENGFKKKIDFEESKNKLESLEKENSEFKTKLEESNKKLDDQKKSIEKLESEKKDLATKLDEIEATEAITKKRKMIDLKISESKLPKEVITDIWISDLMTLEEAKDGDKIITIESQVDERIEDRLKIVSKNKKIKSSGDEFQESNAKESKKTDEQAGDEFMGKLK